MLASLQYHGFLENDPETDKYQPGIKVFLLRQVAANQMNIIALPMMKELADISGESVILTIRDGMFSIASKVVEGNQAITWKTSFGNRLPLHRGASKKVILAFQSREKN